MTTHWSEARLARFLKERGKGAVTEKPQNPPAPPSSVNILILNTIKGKRKERAGKGIGGTGGKGEPVLWRWGSLADKSHLWTRCGPNSGQRADCSGWVTACGAMSRNSTPDGNTSNPCEGCLQQEV